MRSSLGVLIAIVLAAGCMEQTAPAAVPDRADAIAFPSLVDQVLSGQEAVRHHLRVLEYELANENYLSVNAGLNGLSVEQRRGKVSAELEHFKKLDAESMAASSSSHCPARELEDYDTYLRASAVMPGMGAWVYSTGFSVADSDNINDGTIHRISTYVEGGAGHYPGNPLYTDSTGVDRTSGCVKVFSVSSSDIYIPITSCWWAYGESMHRVINTDTEEYTSALYDRCGGPRVSNPFF